MRKINKQPLNIKKAMTLPEKDQDEQGQKEFDQQRCKNTKQAGNNGQFTAAYNSK